VLLPRNFVCSHPRLAWMINKATNFHEGDRVEFRCLGYVK